MAEHAVVVVLWLVRGSDCIRAEATAYPGSSRANAVVAFNAAEEWSQNGSEDIAHEVLDGAYDAE